MLVRRQRELGLRQVNDGKAGNQTLQNAKHRADTSAVEPQTPQVMIVLVFYTSISDKTPTKGEITHENMTDVV